MRNRVLLCFLIILLLMPSYSLNIFAKTVVTEEQEGLVDALGLLELIKNDDNSFDYTRCITRGEFTATVMKLKRFDNIQTKTTYFSDIRNHSYENQINCAADAGVVHGYETKEFRPDAQITVTEAKNILGRALGYQSYERLISTLDLTDDVTSDEGNVTGAVMTVMLFNMLNEHIPEISNLMGNGDYSVKKSELTFLNEYYDIYDTEGILTATEATSLRSIIGAGENCIMIDDVFYKTDSDYTQSLGTVVKCYYQESEDGNISEIIYLGEISKKMDELLIDAADIESYNDNILTYTVNRDTKSTKDVKIALFPNSIFNGQYAKLSAEEFMPDFGSIRLVDANRDGLYETVNIISYEYYVAERISKTNLFISDKHGKRELELEVTDAIQNKAIYFSGRKVDLDYIKSDDVLEVKASKNMDILIINMLSKKVDGKVTSYSDDYIGINGTEYENFRGMTNTPSMNDTGRFYFNDAGQLVAFIEGDSGIRYGYLLKAFYDMENDSTSIKVVTDRGEVKRINFAEKVQYTDYQTNESFRKLSSEIYYLIDGVYDLIMYDTDSKGDINKIIRYKDNSGLDRTKYDGYDDTVSFSKDAEFTGIRIYGRTNPGINYLIDNDTKVFIMPSSPVGVKDKDFKSGNLSILQTDMRNQTVRYYSADEDRTLGAMVVVQEIKDDANYDRIVHNTPFVVTSTGWTATDDNDVKFYAQGYENGLKKKILFSDDELKSYASLDFGFASLEATSLEFGDIIVYNLDSYGEVSQFMPLMDVSACINGNQRKYFEGINDGVVNANDALGNCHTIFGKVMDVSPNVVIVNPNENTHDKSWNRVYRHAATMAYMVDIDTKEIRVADKNDIDYGNDIFMRDRLYTMNFMVIYK